MNGNFFAELQAAFVAVGARAALHLPGGAVWSYEKLLRNAGKVASVLKDAGLGGGERVLVQVEKSPEALALYLGTLMAGGIYVPLNTAYTGSEVRYFLRDALPRVVVLRPDDERVLAQAFAVKPAPCVLTLGADDEGSLAEAMRSAPSDSDPVCRAAEDVAAIVYTSGTTGRAKGAMLTHANLASNARALRDCWGWRQDDVLLHVLPLFHAHGLFIALHCALLGGTPIILLPRFDAAEVIRYLPRATVMMGVPTFYTRLLDNPSFGTAQCAGVRLFVSGSAPLTEQTFQAFATRTGHRILERYGMSETIVNTSNPLDGVRLAGTVGFALPGVAVRVVDESGAPVPAAVVGMIEVRGENVFKGYWRMPEKTAEEFRADGFFITGDLGSLAGDGRLTIVGRSKDLIISGGYNVYPREVEAALDALDEVVESTVIGVPHPDFGEAVVAVLVPAAEPLELGALRAALSQHLARFKHPKWILNLPELPRNSMGKVQKSRLRQDHAGLFER